MPTIAPTTEDIRNFKGHFRRATKSILEAGGWNASALERAMKVMQASVRQEITFDLGETMNEATLDSGTHVYDYFVARLRIRIVTSRRQNQSFAGDEARELHEKFVSQTLDLLAEEKKPFTEQLLPYYAVKTIRPMGTRSDFEILYFEDFTDVDFGLEFGIRSTAWPLSV